MKYCKRCLIPTTKPDVVFVDGLCSGCLEYDRRLTIDWKAKEDEFVKLADRLKVEQKNAPYDLIVAVSGGKDSLFEIEKVKDYGLHPLAVNFRTCDLSDIGQRNLDNISLLGNDVIEVVPNSRIRAAINRHCLETVGDVSWPEHVGIFTAPLIVAKQMHIPIIMYGENPQSEYGAHGGDQDVAMATDLAPRRWLSEFGGLNGLRVSDVQGALGLADRDMYYYTYPQNIEGIRQIFLGSYFPWDGLENAQFAAARGFETSIDPVEGSGFDFENLDNRQTGIHDRFKFLKYGFGRATDICSNFIRRGRMTRDEAIEHVNEWDNQYPATYLGDPLDEILDRIGMTVDEYNTISDVFTNKELFKCLGEGEVKPKFVVGE